MVLDADTKTVDESDGVSVALGVTLGVALGVPESVVQGVLELDGVMEGVDPTDRESVAVAVWEGVSDGDSVGESVPVPDRGVGVMVTSVGDAVSDTEGVMAADAVAVKPAGLAEAVGTAKGEGCDRPAARRLPS